MNIDQLFDMRGARAGITRRVVNLVSGCATVLLTAGILLTLAQAGQLSPELWSPLLSWSAQQFLLRALLNTLLAGAAAIMLSVPLGTLLAIGRLSSRRLVSLTCAVIIEVLRSLPLLFVVYFFLLALPGLGLRIPPFWQLVGAIVRYSSGVFAELFRAGILALPRGQFEAGISLGLSRGLVMRTIVLPQVIRSLLPALLSQCVRVLKETTLGYVVSYPELLRRGQTLGEYLSGSFLQVYFEVAVIFILMNGGLSALALLLDHRLNHSTPRPRRRSYVGSRPNRAPQSRVARAVV